MKVPYNKLHFPFKALRQILQVSPRATCSWRASLPSPQRRFQETHTIFIRNKKQLKLSTNFIYLNVCWWQLIILFFPQHIDLKMGVVRSFNLYPIVQRAANLHSNTRIYNRRKEITRCTTLYFTEVNFITNIQDVQKNHGRLPSAERGH
jgi:hypothetical protein